MGCLKIFKVNGKKAKKKDRYADRLPKWVLVLHFAAKNCIMCTKSLLRLKLVGERERDRAEERQSERENKLKDG